MFVNIVDDAGKMKQTGFHATLLNSIPFMMVLASAAIAISFYFPALNYPFISDDSGYVAENAKLAGLHFSELGHLFTEPYNDFSEFLPLRDFSYWLDMSLFGLTPTAFRVHSILCYLFCLMLVYAVTSKLWRYFKPMDVASAAWVAAVVTLLFALNPAHTEAVIWIAGRKDVLSGMYSMLALWLAIHAKREQGLSSLFAIATLFALLAAMLSKATAVAVSPVAAMLWVIFWYDTPKLNRQNFQLMWPVAILLLAVCIAFIFAAIITTRIPFYLGTEGVIRTLAVLGWLVRLAFTPESRHFFYPVFEDGNIAVMVALGVSVVLAGGICTAMILRKRSLESFSVVAFLLLCLPSIQLIPYAPPSLASDRFVFLAAWPAILLLVSLVWRLKLLPRAAIFLLIALVWGFQAHERVRDWHSFETLIEADYHDFPGFSMPAMYETDIQLSQGLIREATKTASNIAIPEVRSSMMGLVKAHQAVISISPGDPHDAIMALLEYSRGLKQIPAQAQWNAPVRLIWKANRQYLRYEWQSLTKLFPGDASVRYNAGLSLFDVRDYAAAVPHLTAANESTQLTEEMRGAVREKLDIAHTMTGRAAGAEATAQ